MLRWGAIAAAACALTACVSYAPAPPRESEAYANFLIARVANLRGDHSAASARYVHALGASPRDPVLLEGALTAALAVGDLERADILSRVEPDGELASYSRLVRASQALASGRYRQAREQLDAMEGDAAEELTARMMLTWARAGEGRVDDVAGEVGRIAGIRPYGALFAYQQALAYDYAGQNTEAAAAYAEAASGGLWLPPAVERHADLLARMGSRDDAAVRLRNGARQPDNVALAAALARMDAGQRAADTPLTPARGAAISLYGLSAIFVQERDTTRALVTLSLALMLDPRFDAARFSFADIQSDLEHYQEARTTLARIAPSSLYASSGRALQAWVLFREGRQDEAIALAEQNAATGESRSQRALADLYRRVDRYAEAEAIYSRLIESEPNDWRLYFARGAARERLNRGDEAEADLVRALELSPDQPDVLNYLGYMRVDRGERLEEALAMILRAVELRPLSGAIIDSLGWAYYRMGDYDQALGYLERAVELEPADPTLNDHLGDVYWQLDRRTEARFQWRRALSLEPDDTAAIEAKLEDGLPPTRAATR